MAKLQELKERLNLLPEKHRLKNLVGKLTEYRNQITQAAKQLDLALGAEAHLETVFGQGASTVAADERKRAGQVSKRLATKIRARLEAVSDPRSRANDDVTAINEGAAKASRDVKQAWQRLLDQRLKPFERLAEVATRLALPGAGDLEQTMTALKAARSGVPSTALKAQEVAGLLQDLPRAVQNLGLEDAAVQRFLIDATQGSAKLKTFHEAEAIAAFIAKHNLWDLFRVSTPTVTANAS
jgi:hypothetical protein